MRNITLAIKEVKDWCSLGLALKIPNYKLKEIKSNQQFVGPKQCKVLLNRSTKECLL